MKRQNKKAFTLVELLVVIAILAILAAVAVVGYTSFIKNAAVSNDESVVAQMNRYLEALKADSTSEFYGKDIDDSNIGALLAELKAQGLESVEPHAEKYGYHYYFNEKDQKFVLADNGEGYITGAGRHFSLFASAADEGTYNSLSPYSCFTEKGYLFADLGGEWAELVEGFGSVTSEDQLAELYEGAGNMELGGQPIYGLAALMDVTAFVTEEGIFQTSDKERVNVEIQEERTGDAYPIYGYVTNLDGTSTPLSQENPLLNPTEEYSDLVIPEGVTYVATDFINNIVKSEAKVTVEDQEVDVKVNVTFDKENGKDIADALDLEAHVVNTNVTVVNANGTKVEIKTTVTTESDGSTTITTEVKVETEVEIHPVEIKNWTTDFDLIKSENIVVKNGNNYVAWDDGEFTLSADNFVGKIAGQPVANKSIDWRIIDATGDDAAKRDEYITISGGKVTLNTNGGLVPRIDSITIQATAKDKGEAIETIVINLVRVSSVTGLKLTYEDGGNTASNAVVDNMTLLNSGDVAKDYTISYDNIVLNHADAPTDMCDSSISWTYDGQGASANGTNVISVSGEGKGTLNINIGSYIRRVVSLNIGSTKNFIFVPVSTNFKFLGNSNSVLLSDLFKLRDGVTEVPAGAELVVYNGTEFNDDTYMNPHRGELNTTASGEPGLTVDKSSQAITGTNFNDFAIQFAGLGNKGETIRIAIRQNGVRISNDIIVEVVDATNIREYSDLTSTLNTSNAFTKNIVFVEDIAMTTNVDYLTIPAGKTLYGNGFTFDIKNGRIKQEGIINLQGTLRDIMVVGKTYNEYQFQAGENYGSSAVNANGANAYIYNSYIANTRSPLRSSGANVVIENSVIFGGRYANIDMTGGTIHIKGNVTIVQQLYSIEKANNGGLSATNVIGMGISAWFNDGKKNVVIEDGANLVQYNFMDNSISQYLPTLSVVGTPVLDLKKPFNDMFTNTSKYGEYMSTGSNGKLYVNSGIISTDKYMLDYSVTGSPSDGGFGNHNYLKGDVKTVTVDTAVGDNEKFIIAYDTRFTPNVGTVISAGFVEVTGAQLKQGVGFTVGSTIGAGFLGTTDPTAFMFHLRNDNYLTVNVSGAGSTNEYSNITYEFADDLSGSLGLINKVTSTMHDRGIHYGKMVVGVNTPKSTATAVRNYTYQNLLEQYIEMTDGDGKDDNFYTPENFTFVNGSVTNYWNK